MYLFLDSLAKLFWPLELLAKGSTGTDRTCGDQRMARNSKYPCRWHEQPAEAESKAASWVFLCPCCSTLLVPQQDLLLGNHSLFAFTRAACCVGLQMRLCINTSGIGRVLRNLSDQRMQDLPVFCMLHSLMRFSDDFRMLVQSAHTNQVA